MKRLRYVLMIALSLLVIYSGVGISVCSCLTCEVACLLCSTPCSGCDADEESDASCEDEGCSINIYKVNLAQQNTQLSASISSFELFCGLLSDFQFTRLCGELEIPYVVPPSPDGSRHFLALYSILLI